MFWWLCRSVCTSTLYQHSYVLHMPGPFFDHFNPFKGSTSVHPEGFRVSVLGSMGCPDTLLPCVHRKATLKTHIMGQFISFSHPRRDFIVFCLRWGTVWWTLPHFTDWNSTPITVLSSAEDPKGHLLLHFVETHSRKDHHLTALYYISPLWNSL